MSSSEEDYDESLSSEEDLDSSYSDGSDVKPKKKQTPTKKKKPVSDDESDDSVPIKRKTPAKRTPTKPKAKKVMSESEPSESEEEIKPKPSKRAKAVAKKLDDSSDESSASEPKKKTPKKSPAKPLPKAKPSVVIVDSDQDDDRPVAPKTSTSGLGEGKDKAGPRAKVVDKVPTSAAPLVVPPTLQRNTFLVQCEDSKVDFSGDVGAVGRLRAADADGLTLDLKGFMYRGDIVPCSTMMVVGAHQVTSEGVAKTQFRIESVMNDFVQLTSVGNVFDSEATIDGLVDDSLYDDEELLVDDEDAWDDDEKKKDKKADKKAKARGNKLLSKTASAGVVKTKPTKRKPKPKGASKPKAAGPKKSKK